MDDRARPELYSGYVGAHCPSESHAEHIWRSESKQNPSEIPETKITLAFGSWTLPVLVEQCEDQELDIRRNAMRVLCESCLTTPKRVVEAVEAGAVEALARLVSDADADVRLFVSAALLLVAKSATGKRALMGTIQSVAPLLDDKEVRVRENAYGALLAVCSTCDGLESVVAGCYVPIFCGKARAEESRIQPFCLLCLYHCLKEPSGAGLAQALGESAVAICIALLEHDFHVVRHRAADLLALLCFSVEAKLAAIAGGAVEALAGLLQDPASARVRGAGAGALMTICTEDEAKRRVLEGGTVPRLVALLDEDSDLIKVKREGERGGGAEEGGGG